jgi:Family of unknown function (DUF5994)
MSTTAQPGTIAAASPPTEPRLVLAPHQAGQAVLDGGWWPRSWDPVTELPGLVAVLSGRYGPIRQVMLNRDAWDSRFRRLAVGADVVRMGWFTSLDPALAIATTEHGDQLDLLVVPPRTSATLSRAAMEKAADPTDTTRAPDVLATIRARNDDTDRDAVWDNEGGHPAEPHPHRPTSQLLLSS